AGDGIRGGLVTGVQTCALPISTGRALCSAGSPPSTARVWSPEAPYDCEKDVSLPADVAWNAGMIFANAAAGVEYATRSIFVSVVAPPAAPAAARVTATAAKALLIRGIGLLDLFRFVGRASPWTNT